MAFNMLPPHIWAAVFSQLEDPFDRTALAVVSKTTARIAADTYRQSVPSTVCQRPIQLRAVAMEARQAFKHRKAEVFVDIDSANNLWGLAYLETLQVSFAHMREYADDRQGCLTICIPESVTKLACACQVPTAPGDERPPDLFLTGLEHLQNLKMLELSDQGDCVGLTVGGMEGLSALQNLQELRIAKASVSGVSAMQHSAINLPVLQRLSVIDCTALSWIMDFTQCKQLTQVILLRNSCLVQIPACVNSLHFAYYGLNYM